MPGATTHGVGVKAVPWIVSSVQHAGSFGGRTIPSSARLPHDEIGARTAALDQNQPPMLF